MEDDDEPQICVEAAEAARDLVARDDPTGFVDVDWAIGRAQLDLDWTATLTAKLVHADADEDAMEPGIPAIGIAEPWGVAPGKNQRFLDRIPGAIRIAEDQASGRVETARGSLGQRLEGAVVALLCPLDEISLHVAAIPSRPVWPLSPSMGFARPKAFAEIRRCRHVSAFLRARGARPLASIFRMSGRSA